MTELEALAKDCIENHTHRLIDKPTKQDIYLREESIYIQGYRECERRDKKRIAELKKENARLTTNEKSLLAERKIIVKENAELRLKLEALEGQTPWKDIKDKSKVIGKLVTAKDLLKQWLSLCGFKVEKLAKDTEQFLNSEVEK